MIFDFFKDVMKKIDKEKITQSSAVNVEGYVLDAREKNPSISGTNAVTVVSVEKGNVCICSGAIHPAFIK